jgi:hypothetical protein
MPKTFQTVQRIDGELGNKEGNTRPLLSTDIVRWWEHSSWSAHGAALESTSADTLNSTTRGTVNAPVLKVPIPRVKNATSTSKGNYILLKRYNGFVVSKGVESFLARLFEDRSDYPVLEAEFDLEELSDADRELVVEGAALVWTIGYHEEESRKRESLIYMRRRPGWNRRELEQAELATQELTRDIQWK